MFNKGKTIINNSPNQKVMTMLCRNLSFCNKYTMTKRSKEGYRKDKIKANFNIIGKLMIKKI